ncbi:MAG TPA: holo-ACP synthase [Firmicutes bacterium]|nr:holo-ACP synthase [Bacillota bacterium]
MGYILGIGSDVVEVARVRRAWERFGERFLVRVYTPEELGYCLKASHGGRVAERLAGRFAAKEAVMKSLGCGPGRAPWRTVAILPGEGGPPRVELRGAAARRAAELGIAKVLVTITHEKEYALAVAIAEAAVPKS